MLSAVHAVVVCLFVCVFVSVTLRYCMTSGSAMAEGPRGTCQYKSCNYKTSHLKTLSCGIICVILRLAVLIQYRTVTDTHTQRVHADGQTHDDGIYRT